MLARAGHPVTLIGRPAHVLAVQQHGLQLEMAGQVLAVPLLATTDLAAVRGADLVLFCVKSTDTDAVARQIAPLLAADALVLGLQNGVDNAAVMQRHLRQTRLYLSAGTAAFLYAIVDVQPRYPIGVGHHTHGSHNTLTIGQQTPASRHVDEAKRACKNSQNQQSAGCHPSGGPIPALHRSERQIPGYQNEQNSSRTRIRH